MRLKIFELGDGEEREQGERLRPQALGQSREHAGARARKWFAYPSLYARLAGEAPPLAVLASADDREGWLRLGDRASDARYDSAPVDGLL